MPAKTPLPMNEGGNRQFGWPVAGLALLALLLSFAFWRAGREESLNCDDIYTLALINQRPADVIDLTLLDLHPPGYYLLLKAWIKLGKVFITEPGTQWARMPGLLSMILMTGTALWVGSRIFGKSGGAVLAVAIACSALTANLTNVLRGYAIGSPAVVICFLLMLRLSRKSDSDERGYAALWMGYGVCASVALWTHLLTGLIVFLLGVWWCGLTLVLARRQGLQATMRSGLFVGGALAQTFVVIGYLPWLAHLQQQISNHEGPRPIWLTPPTGANLFRVFFLWYAWGPGGGELIAGTGTAVQLLLGVLTLLVPGSAIIWLRRPSANPAKGNAAAMLAAMGLSIGFMNVLVLWGSDRLGIQHLFLGTRYTVFSHAIWGAGIAGLALWGGRGKPALTWLLIAPWVATNVTGLLSDGIPRSKGLLGSAIEDGSSPMPPRGSDLYVLPESLMPYFRQTLAEYNVRPAVELFEGNVEAPRRMLEINMWAEVETPANKIIKAVLESKEIFRSVDRIVFPADSPRWNQFKLWRMSEGDAGRAEALLRGGLAMKQRHAPPNALMTVDALQLRAADGWNSLEVGETRVPMRWSRLAEARIPLGQALGEGGYGLEINLLRIRYPETTTTLSIQLEGEEDRVEIPLSGGWRSVQTQLRATKPHSAPVMILRHPVVRLDAYEPAAIDHRPMGVLFYDASLTELKED